MARTCVSFFGLFCILWHVSFGENNQYENYTLVRLFPTNEKQMEAIINLEHLEGQVKLLKGSRGFNDSTDVLVPQNRMNFIKEYARHINVMTEVKIENYGRLFNEINPVYTRSKSRKFSVFEYHSYDEILEHLEKIAQKYQKTVTLQDVGKSYEGRSMKLVKISTNPTGCNPIIFIDAGIHAREWTAPAMAIYLIYRLTQDRNARERELIGVDWYILPVVNPDGYEYSRLKGNRMWRKTRSMNFNCYGVDGNRNYGFMWGVIGASKDPCNEQTYAGPRPFSEVETKFVKSVMEENSARLKLYVTLHTYGNYLVYPWGYTGKKLPKEWEKLDNLARDVSAEVVRAGGLPFKVTSSGQWYPAGGASDDYAFGAVGVPYAYTMELTDGYEFFFPENLLYRTLPQYYEGFKVFAVHIANEFCELTEPRSR